MTRGCDIRLSRRLSQFGIVPRLVATQPQSREQAMRTTHTEEGTRHAMAQSRAYKVDSRPATRESRTIPPEASATSEADARGVGGKGGGLLALAVDLLTQSTGRVTRWPP